MTAQIETTQIGTQKEEIGHRNYMSMDLHINSAMNIEVRKLDQGNDWDIHVMKIATKDNTRELTVFFENKQLLKEFTAKLISFLGANPQ